MMMAVVICLSTDYLARITLELHNVLPLDNYVVNKKTKVKKNCYLRKNKEEQHQKQYRTRMLTN